MCEGWSARAQWMDPYTSDVPVEGYLLLPVQLMQGTSSTASTPPPAAVPTVEVRDENGDLVPGAAELFGGYVGDYVALGTFHVLWRGDAGFTPGARYEVRALADNPDDCSVGDLDFRFEFVVDERTMEERLASALSEIGAPSLAWRREEFPPQCCLARSDALCPTGGPCYACMKTMVQLEVVFAHEPALVSPYRAYSAQSSAEPGGAANASAPFSATDDEFRFRSLMCQCHYCARVTVASPISGDSVSTDEVCIPGSDPIIEPPDGGAELFFGNPCADGSGSGTWNRSDPPECWQYPELSWFESEAEGLTALGAAPPDAGAPRDAGTPSPDASDGAGRGSGRSGSGCAFAGRGANVFPFGILLCFLPTLARRIKAMRPKR
jgi:hypothetical protein